MIRQAIYTLLTLSLAGVPALAHRLDAEYERVGQGYRIEFFMGDGSAAPDLRVTAQLADGEPMEIGRTDENGIIQFVPPSPGEWSIVGTGAGHSTARHPLVIRTDALPESSANAGDAASTEHSPATQAAGRDPTAQVSEAVARSSRGRFPALEVFVSLAFITVLTLITLLMMRRSAAVASRPADLDQLSHEVAHLREAVRQLRTEMDAMKEPREAGPR
ncbi:MAG TPA: hypothetical protein PL151_15875 [Phycisphaerae bacterium]|nr:hypothetical protein [Phycisphaerae bacterium]HOJ73435.1 hypothetical protein [Phycisphaerae bacterium]HOM51044.1 hypothetical protein [Phycisphaerae bacterium]HON66307.1 hypothetical protein [Phycisphaerae bacterium]HOQ85181.1 hypothetical protein [Phycisphaerae bacterium]